MSERNRRMLAELLRCGADTFSIGNALHWLGYRSGGPWHREAIAAWSAAAESMPRLDGWTYAHICLEAAQRCEEGSWP